MIVLYSVSVIWAHDFLVICVSFVHSLFFVKEQRHYMEYSLLMIKHTLKIVSDLESEALNPCLIH